MVTNYFDKDIGH